MKKYEYWNECILKEWIQNETIVAEAVDFCAKFGNHLAKKNDVEKKYNEGAYIDNIKFGKKVYRNSLTTSQLRKFFGEVKRMQLKGYSEKTKSDFILLKPKLAYAVARAKDQNAKIHDFYKVITDAMNYVDSPRSFRNFVNLFEAIIAFHKAAEESKLEIL